MNLPDFFDKDYYENGKNSGKSLYEIFHWIPERSFKEAHWFIKNLYVGDKKTILDFGCAKGYFVKALRILGYDAYGYDFSKYAIDNCDEFVKSYVTSNIKDYILRFDYCFCKDVLEHSLDDKNLLDNLELIKAVSKNILLIVPLAEKGVYIAKEYEKDKSHFIRKSFEEWKEIIEKVFENCITIDYSFELQGIKDNWESIEKSNLFVKIYE